MVEETRTGRRGELGVPGGGAGGVDVMAGSGDGRLNHHRRRHLRRKGPRPADHHGGLSRALEVDMAPVPSETLVLGNGNTMGNIMVWVSRDSLAGKTWPVPQTPVTIDQSGCQDKPHVMGIMAGQTYRILNSDGVLHNIHALPKVNTPFNKPMPATVKENDHEVQQAGAGVRGQVRCSPVDERLGGRVQSSLLLGDRHWQWEFSLFRVSTQGPMRSPCGTNGWGPRPPRSRSAPATPRRRISNSPCPPQSSDSDTGKTKNGRMSQPGVVAASTPHAAHEAHHEPPRLLAPLRLLGGPQGDRHPGRDHRPPVPPVRLLADDVYAVAARLSGRRAAAARSSPGRRAHAGGGTMLPDFYNELGAMHGTIMVFLGVVPLAVGGSGTSSSRSRLEPRTWRSRGSTWPATGSFLAA